MGLSGTVMARGTVLACASRPGKATGDPRLTLGVGVLEIADGEDAGGRAGEASTFFLRSAPC